MNMHSAIANRDTHNAGKTKRDWNGALNEYWRLRKISDETPLEDGERADAAVDAYCDAMDRVIKETEAPDVSAIATKLELIIERYNDTDILDVEKALLTDAQRLSAADLRAASRSLILQLHQRYEEIWDAHNVVDEHQPARSENKHREYSACARAMGELAKESALVQLLLLRQIPTTDEELSIVAMHLAAAYEAEQPLTTDEQQAIEIAISHTLDYLMSEGRADMERLGRQMSNATMIVWENRRHRQGVFDDWINRPGTPN